MEQYDTALMCLNGHLINDKVQAKPELNQKFCSDCGEQTISSCPACEAPIRGASYEVDGKIINFEEPSGEPSLADYESAGLLKWWPEGRKAPRYCRVCGKPYPWTEQQSQAVAEVIDELDELAEEEKAKLKRSIPDILAETPSSETAILRFKKAIAKVGQAGGKLLRDVLVKVASEVVKKSMGF